jgi:multidrug resistance efflux pump
MLTTGAVLSLAAVALALLIWRMLGQPWTRDGQVHADVILVTPRVTGVVVEVAVVDNQFVKQGDILFQIDPDDFELAVASARVQLDRARDEVASLEAAVVAARSGVTEADAGVTTARAQIDAARAQVASAEGTVAGAAAGLNLARASIDESTASLEQAIKDRDRAARLAAEKSGSVARAESTAAAAKEKGAALDGARAGMAEAEATMSQAQATLRQAQAGLASAEAGLAEAEAKGASAQAQLVKARADLGAPGDENVRVRDAQVALARSTLDLDRSSVRASVDGYITNLNVDVGDYAAPGVPLLALVNTASLHVRGFFRETQLRRIEPGDRAVITLMSHRGDPIEGTVESIGWAINPPDVATTEGTSGLVPQVEPSFDWIRLAQRVPVRIRIDAAPEDVRLISGTTASIVIRPQTD